MKYQTLRQRAELLCQELGRLKEEARREGVVLVVEGERDKEALESLGIEGKFVVLKCRKGIRQILWELEAKEVIVLTDVDREGEKLLRVVEEELIHKGIKVNKLFRERISSLAGLAHVQGLPSLIKKWERKLKETIRERLSG